MGPVFLFVLCLPLSLPGQSHVTQKIGILQVPIPQSQMGPRLMLSNQIAIL